MSALAMSAQAPVSQEPDWVQIYFETHGKLPCTADLDMFCEGDQPQVTEIMPLTPTDVPFIKAGTSYLIVRDVEARVRIKRRLEKLLR